MCRLFGLHVGPDPVSATFWLVDAPDSLAVQSRRNPDGVGIGVFGPDGAPIVDKQPVAAWQDTDFMCEARELRGTTFVAHVRYASTGELAVRNTHPFEQEGRVFAHNGVIHGLDQLDERLRTLDARHLVHGETDSERLFALITAETARHGGAVTEGITAALTWVAANLPVYSLNFVLATATDLWALRYPATHELYVLERPPGGAAGAAAALDSRSERIHARCAHLDARSSLIVASEPMDLEPGWRLLDPGELIHSGADLTVESTRPLPPQPRLLLRRSDLDARTAASQHEGGQ